METKVYVMADGQSCWWTPVQSISFRVIIYLLIFGPNTVSIILSIFTLLVVPVSSFTQQRRQAGGSLEQIYSVLILVMKILHDICICLQNCFQPWKSWSLQLWRSIASHGLQGGINCGQWSGYQTSQGIKQIFLVR